jgi:hypothetical protein
MFQHLVKNKKNLLHLHTFKLKKKNMGTHRDFSIVSQDTQTCLNPQRIIMEISICLANIDFFPLFSYFILTHSDSGVTKRRMAPPKNSMVQVRNQMFLSDYRIIGGISAALTKQKFLRLD